MKHHEPNCRPPGYFLATMTAAITAIFLALTLSSSQAHNGKYSIAVKGGKRCVTSNGLPNHNTGKFPNSGNPNSISKQNIKLCVTTKPRKGRSARKVQGSIGIGINGVQFRPGTADYYDPSSPRGHSRDRSSGWNLDGLGAAKTLGMDRNNAHVDNRGLYHYHGIANALVKSGKGSLIGWAADGFEIHYIGSKARSSYRLKKGNRPSGPGGKFNGKYVQDWVYSAGSGNLDQCNGGKIKGKFVYFATDTYPFLPHCLWGKVSSDFKRDGQRGGIFGIFGKRESQNRRKRQRPRLAQGNGNRRKPPVEAVNACARKAEGARCSFISRRRNHKITGSCRFARGNTSACVPSRG